MFNWFWKLLGIHCCEEFTQWEEKRARFSRIPTTMDERLHVITRQTGWNQADDGRIQYTEHWQERRCTLCGKIQQRKLAN